jgi:predicted NACHT family NTPase
MIVSGSEDYTLRLWNISGNPIGQPLRGHEGFVRSVAISPDGKMIVSGSEDYTLRLWDISGNPIGQPLHGHEDRVNSVAFSLDGQMIVSGSDDKTLRLWGISGNPIGQPLRGHEGYVRSVAISPDGQMIVSGSDDKTLRLWRDSWRVWLQVCCNRLAYHLISKNPAIDITQGTCAACVKHKIWSGKDLGKILMRQGNDLAREGKVEDAVAKFEQAIKYDPTIDLNPEAEARRLAAPTQVSQGEEL